LNTAGRSPLSGFVEPALRRRAGNVERESCIDRLREGLKAEAFVQLVLGEIAAGADRPAYRKIRIRRTAGQDREYRADFYTSDRHTTRMLAAHEAVGLLDLPFRRAHLQSTAGDLHVRITRKGRPLVSEARPSVPQRPAPQPHDRPKHHRLRTDEPNVLLRALGIQTPGGQIRAGRRGKLRQIEQFLEILSTLEEIRRARGAVHILDCGCGAAYLTFAAHHWLREGLGLDPHTIGLDARADLMARCNRLRDRLGYENLRFESVRIARFVPPAAPHVVLSLHACDTATDEALALAVRAHARAILAAPCCQHELREQLRHESMRAILRHGVLRGRQADIVTDAARAAILRLVGYRCEVIEFVSPEHTTRNLMLRAERRSSQPLPGAIEDYRALKSAWNIRPALERMLGDQIDPLL